jgi:hypothetical protein
MFLGTLYISNYTSDCSFPTSYWGAFNLKMLLPFIIVASASFLFLLSHLWKLYRGSNEYRAEEIVEDPKASIQNSVSKSTLTSLARQVTNWFALVFSFLYTYVVVVLTQPFNCIKQPSGKYTMYLNPGIICFESEWKSNITAVVFYAIIYVFVLPLSLSRFFYKNRTHLDYVRLYFKPMISPYRPEYFWWEMVTLFRKAILALTVQVFSLFMSQRTKIYCVVLVIAVTMMVETVVQPFPTFKNNYVNFLYVIRFVFAFLIVLFSSFLLGGKWQVFFFCCQVD